MTPPPFDAPSIFVTRRRFLLGLTASLSAMALPVRVQSAPPLGHTPLHLLTPIKELIATLNEHVPASLAANKVPGCSLALIRNGSIAWSGAWGLRSTRTSEPVDTSTVFEAASLTKPLFAAAVMTLVQEGRLSLDQPMGDLLSRPYVDDPAVQAKLEMLTPRLVLTHRTGLPNSRGTHPLRFLHEPDTQWSYSGEGFVLLQVALETLTDRPLETLIHERVLNPMGLLRTRLRWSGFESRNVADSHTYKGDSRGKKPWLRASAPSSIHTTPADYAYFMRLFLKENMDDGISPSPAPPGAPMDYSLRPSPQLRKHPPVRTSKTLAPLPPPARILEADSIAQMLTPQTNVDDPGVADRIMWGLGWGLQRSEDGRAFWHWGNNRGFKAFCIGYPDLGLGAVIFTNADYGWKVHREILPLVLGGDPTALNWKV